MTEPKHDIGMIGLGVMGRNLVLNIADHGYSAIGYAKDFSQAQELQKEAGSRAIHAQPFGAATTLMIQLCVQNSSPPVGCKETRDM